MPLRVGTRPRRKRNALSSSIGFVRECVCLWVSASVCGEVYVEKKKMYVEKKKMYVEKKKMYVEKKKMYVEKKKRPIKCMWRKRNALS